MRIDGHLHVWGRSHPDRPYPWTPDPFPVESLIPILDEHRVDLAVHVTPVIEGWDNSYGVEASSRFPDRLRLFGRFDPHQHDVAEALAGWMKAPAASGVRLTAFRSHEMRRLDDAEMGPFWEAAAQLGVPVAVFAPDRLDELVTVARVHPEVTVIVDHLGLGVYSGAEAPLAGLDMLERFAPLDNVIVKVSAMPEVAHTPFPFPDLHGHLRRAVDLFGAGRLVWGSNWPVESATCSYGEAITWIEASGVCDGNELAHLLGGTMQQLLGLD